MLDGLPVVEEQQKKDLEILEFIRQNPLARELEIAKAVSLSRSATHNRLVKLKKLQHLRSGMTVNLNALGYVHRYRIDVKIDPHVLLQEVRRAKGLDRRSKQNDDQEESELKEACKNWNSDNAQEILAFHILSLGDKDPNLIVEDVAVLLGDPADLSVTIRLKKADLVYSFVTERLRGLRSISSTTTCIEAWSCSQEMQKRLLKGRPKRTRGRKPQGQPQ